MPVKTGLFWRANAEPSTDCRLVWNGANLLSRTAQTVLWWKFYPPGPGTLGQTGYYADTWSSHYNGSFAGSTYEFGAHGYPCDGTRDPTSGLASNPTNGTGTDHYFEIAGLGSADYIATPDPGAGGNPVKQVVKGRWYLHARQVEQVGGDYVHRFYPDLIGDPSFSIIVGLATGSLAAAGGTPAFYIGPSDWRTGQPSAGRADETPFGVIRGIRLFNSGGLSVSDMTAEGWAAWNGSNAPATSAGAAALWYINDNPTPWDVADKSTAGHSPSFDLPDTRPNLWSDESPIKVPAQGFANGSTGDRGARHDLAAASWLGGRLDVAKWFADELAAGSGTTSRSETFSLNLAVQLAQAATASISAAVQAPQAATTAINLAVQQALAVTHNVDAAVQLARSAAAAIEAAIQAERSASASIDVGVQAERSATLSADLAVQLGRTASASIDAYVQAATEIAFAIDMLVQEGKALSVAADLAVQAARTATLDVNLAVQLARTAAASIEAAVQVALSAAASIDTAVQAARSAGASIDLYVQVAFVVGASIDTAVRVSPSAGAAIDVAVAIARSLAFDVSVVVAVQRSVASAIEAAVRASAQAGASIDLYIDDPSAVVHGWRAVKRVVESVRSNVATLVRPPNTSRIRRR